MTRQTALDILIAAAICAYPIMSCKACPVERADGQCHAPKAAEIEQAVCLLKGGGK